MAKPIIKTAPDGNPYIVIHADTSEIDDALEKAERLYSTLEKAKSIVNNLACAWKKEKEKEESP